MWIWHLFLGYVISVNNCYDKNKICKERRDWMITTELTQKIDTLTNEEFRMVEVYVDNILEYSKRRKKESAWEKYKLI